MELFHDKFQEYQIRYHENVLFLFSFACEEKKLIVDLVIQINFKMRDVNGKMFNDLL